MSTLTSAQLHVKRSSTRLHAPPGGVSSLSFGCGGFGTAEPADELPNKEEVAFSRPVSGGNKYAPPPASFSNNNALSGYPGYSGSQADSAPYSNNYAPQQQAYSNNYAPQQQQAYQPQVFQQPSYHNAGWGNNNVAGPSYGSSNGYPSGGRPPSSRSSCRSSSSSRSWGSQPPLTASKRDQNWEKKRQLWLARKNGSGSYTGSSRSSTGYSEPRPMTATSTWSAGPAMADSAESPASPLSKFMHQHAQQQQQQPPPPSPAAEYQRLGTASSTRSSSSHSYAAPPYQAPAPAGYSTSSSYSRGGLSTASSTASRRQPPGGHCQWALA